MGHYHPLYMPNEPMGTSSLSVLDEDGMAVALTTTINLNFGSMLYDTGTGIILSSQMDVSRYNPVKGLAGLPLILSERVEHHYKSMG